MRTVLACVDFSDTSIPVLDEAARLADALGARIALLYVQPMEAEYIGIDVGYVTHVPATGAAVQDRPAFGQLQQAARRLEAPGRTVETAFHEGQVVDAIIEEAEARDADVLVLGSHGHGALYHLLMGSVTESVLRQIKRPVLVVPAPKEEDK